MKFHLLVLPLLLNITSFSQIEELPSFGEENDSLLAKSAELTIENLQGSWKEQNKRDYTLAGDEMYETVRKYDHIHVEGNKVWCFEYPIKGHWVADIRIVNGQIDISNRKYYSRGKSWVPQPIGYGGSSAKCNFIISENLKTLCFGGNSYSKDSLDQKVINKMKSGKFNPECLVGKWKLKTSFDSGYDGWGQVEYKYPWKLPAVLNITKESVHRFYGGGLFYVRVDGEKKPFKINVIHVSDWFSELKIIPYKWSTFDAEKFENTAFVGIHTDEVRYEFSAYDED